MPFSTTSPDSPCVRGSEQPASGRLVRDGAIRSEKLELLEVGCGAEEGLRLPVTDRCEPELLQNPDRRDICYHCFGPEAADSEHVESEDDPRARCGGPETSPPPQRRANEVTQLPLFWPFAVEVHVSDQPSRLDRPQTRQERVGITDALPPPPLTFRDRRRRSPSRDGREGGVGLPRCKLSSIVASQLAKGDGCGHRPTIARQEQVAPLAWWLQPRAPPARRLTERR